MSNRNITSPEQTRKIFLGGINPGTSEDYLKDYFSKYGEITDCCVIKTSGPEKKSRGFGFVTFLKASSVNEVIGDQSSSRLIIDDREVEIKRAIHREDPSVEPLHQKLRRKIFVGGIRTLTEERIAEFFLQFGKIEETVIPIDKQNNNKKRGFAFVIFQDASAVTEVVAIQNHTIDGVVVECKRATPQEKDLPRIRTERQGRKGRDDDEEGGNFSPIGAKGGFNRGWGPGGFPGGFGASNSPGFGPGGYGGAGWGRGWGGWGGWGGGPGWGTGGAGWGYGSGYGSGWGTGGYGSGWGANYGGAAGGNMGLGNSGGGSSGGGGGSGGAGSGFEGRGGGAGGFGGSMLGGGMGGGGMGGGAMGAMGGGAGGMGGGAGGGFGGGSGGQNRSSSAGTLLPAKGGNDRGGGDFGSNYGAQGSSFGPMRAQNSGASTGRFIGPTVPYGAPYGSGGPGIDRGSVGGGAGGGFNGMGGGGGRRF